MKSAKSYIFSIALLLGLTLHAQVDITSELSASCGACCGFNAANSGCVITVPNYFISYIEVDADGMVFTLSDQDNVVVASGGDGTYEINNYVESLTLSIDANGQSNDAQLTISAFALMDIEIQGFFNDENTSYLSGWKSAHYTYLLWDRNNDGVGTFSANDRPMFFYWDNDDRKLSYIIDTQNMSRLKAQFHSVGIGANPNPNRLLSVDGSIDAEEIIVENVNGADYVFEPNVV